MKKTIFREKTNQDNGFQQPTAGKSLLVLRHWQENKHPNCGSSSWLIIVLLLLHC
jgi:hypothetical protein